MTGQSIELMKELFDIEPDAVESVARLSIGIAMYQMENTSASINE